MAGRLVAGDSVNAADIRGALHSGGKCRQVRHHRVEAARRAAQDHPARHAVPRVGGRFGDVEVAVVGPLRAALPIDRQQSPAGWERMDLVGERRRRGDPEPPIAARPSPNTSPRQLERKHTIGLLRCAVDASYEAKRRYFDRGALAANPELTATAIMNLDGRPR